VSRSDGGAFLLLVEREEASGYSFVNDGWRGAGTGRCVVVGAMTRAGACQLANVPARWVR
jgi:hypothetical protein